MLQESGFYVTVLQTRHTHTSVEAGGLNGTTVRQLEKLVQGELRPDYTVLLDVSVAIGMARANGRGNLDRIEQETLEFFERVRSSYLQQAKNSSGRYRVDRCERFSG